MFCIIKVLLVGLFNFVGSEIIFIFIGIFVILFIFMLRWKLKKCWWFILIRFGVIKVL